MPDTNIRSLVKRTLALPVALLLALAAALSIWIVHLIRSETWVQHSYDVLGRISQTQKLLIDQETGLRAYILTGDMVFLQPYIEGSRDFGASLEAVQKETADNPRQARKIAELQQRYLRWQQNVEEERKLVATDVGGGGGGGVVRDPATRNRLVLRKRQMDEMRGNFASLHDEETHLLQERLDQARRANLTLFAAGALLVLICAALLFLFLRQQLARIDEIYLRKVDESETARRAAEGLAQEVQEQAAAMEQAVLIANRERDAALRALREGRPE